jgi:hypothetical protein
VEFIDLGVPETVARKARTTLIDVKRSITFAVAAAGLTFALAGCGTGINAQTSEQVAAVPGYSHTEGLVGVRNATLAYNGTEGYKSGEEAVINLTLFNNDERQLKVVLSSDSGSLTVDGGSLSLDPSTAKSPKMKIKLTKDVPNGESIPLTIEFVGKAKWAADIPVDTPLSPAPRVKLEVTEGSGEGH